MLKGVLFCGGKNFAYSKRFRLKRIRKTRKLSICQFFLRIPCFIFLQSMKQKFKTENFFITYSYNEAHETVTTPQNNFSTTIYIKIKLWNNPYVNLTWSVLKNWWHIYNLRCFQILGLALKHKNKNLVNHNKKLNKRWQVYFITSFISITSSRVTYINICTSTIIIGKLSYF